MMLCDIRTEKSKQGSLMTCFLKSKKNIFIRKKRYSKIIQFECLVKDNKDFGKKSIIIYNWFFSSWYKQIYIFFFDMLTETRSSIICFSNGCYLSIPCTSQSIFQTLPFCNYAFLPMGIQLPKTLLKASVPDYF